MSNRERISANNATIQACIDKANALPNASGGGGLTPSEGLTFAESYHNATFANNYGWTGFGTCTDTEIVVPSLTPEGYPVISVGSWNDDPDNSFSGVWVQGVSKIYLPDTVREVVPMGFMCGDILKYIKFGKYLRDVDSMQYADGTNPPTDVVLDLSDFALSTPPVLEDTSLFTGVIEVRVPSAMVDKFKTATNWSVAADKIVGV